MKVRGFLPIFTCLVLSSLFAQDHHLALSDFDRVDFGETYFILNGRTELKLEARGACDRNEDRMLSYAWILDMETRKPVWRMTVENSHRHGKRPNRALEEIITLPEGAYGLYYTVAPIRTWGYGYDNFSDFLNDLFGGFKRRKWMRDADQWGVKMWAEPAGQLEKVDGPPEEKGIALTYMGDDQNEETGFNLSESTRFLVYCLGEGDRDGMYDYGWIMNADTGEMAWKMTFRKSRWAGGADKNRVAREEIVLEPGNYQVYYVSDGSHSFDEWNRIAPYDPNSWGITLIPLDSSKGEEVFGRFNPESTRNEIVDLTKIGNHRYEVEAFRLARDTKVRVRCVGEYGYDDRFVDYGWITNASTREKVWEMTRRNTEHAGGAKKNRIYNGTLLLEAGTYEVGYITDDSHAYRRWNAGPPFNPDTWGISVWGTGEPFDVTDVSVYHEQEDPDILVRIVRVGDRERIRKPFTLQGETRVRIYALGEMDDDDAYDYGWIEDEKGRKIWQMQFDDTEHAGGASKNRMINEIIILKPGDYTVHYRSDGSHSYEDWNSSPPHDAAYWGIMLRKEQ